MVKAKTPKRMILSLCHHGVSESKARKRFLEDHLADELKRNNIRVITRGIEPLEINFRVPGKRAANTAHLAELIEGSLLTFVSSEHGRVLSRNLKSEDYERLMGAGKIVIVRGGTHQLKLMPGRAKRRGSRKGPSPEAAKKQRVDFYKRKIASALSEEEGEGQPAPEPKKKPEVKKTPKVSRGRKGRK